MPKELTANEIEAFWETGLLFPKRILSKTEAATLLGELELYESKSGGPVNGKWRYKSHLVFPWINEIMRLPVILDLVEDLWPILQEQCMEVVQHQQDKIS